MITSKEHREHTGWNVLDQVEKHKLIVAKTNLAPRRLRWVQPKLRLTLDYEEDLEAIRNVMDHFFWKDSILTCSAEEIIDAIIENPAMVSMNQNVESTTPGI